jgi:hypothetical protein
MAEQNAGSAPKNAAPAQPDPKAQATADATKTNEQNPPKKEKAPLPDGFITPVQFAKKLSEKLGKDIRPQVIYGYVRNSKDFPSQKNTDGAFIVDEAKAFTWYDQKEARRVEREAAKTAKEAAAAKESSAPAAAKG